MQTSSWSSFDLVASQDTSIPDINGQIDDRILEYGTEIREQLF